MIPAVIASVLSLMWVSVAFGAFPLVGPDEPVRSILLILIDVVVVTLGVVGLVRARRRREPYLLPVTVLCAVAVHWLGSLIGGEVIILFINVPSVILAAVTLVVGLCRLFTWRAKHSNQAMQRTAGRSDV